MIFRYGLSCALSVGIACCSAWGQTGKARPTSPKRQAAIESVREKPGRFDDTWLGVIALEQLKQAACSERTAAAEFKELSGKIEKAVLARLACGSLKDLRAVNDLVYVSRACKYLLLADNAAGRRKFARWLLENRAVSRRMFRACDDVKNPEQAMRNLFELFSAEAEAVATWPDLAVAFAASYPMQHYRRRPEEASMLDSFRWYVNPDNSFRYDLKKMPYELSRFLADTRLGIKERQWAAGKYNRSKNPARSFFDLKYDPGHGDRPKKIKKIPYTILNLRKVGGVCIDQAYYAAEVCKTLGVPAAIVTGRGASGTRIAWVARLKIEHDEREAVWDDQTGRYKSHLHYRGKFNEPAAGRKILDCELSPLCSSVVIPLLQREQADAAVVAARLVEKVRDQVAQADTSVLEKLAGLYNNRFAGKTEGPKKPAADTKWIQTAGNIDLALVENLIAAAARFNPAHTPAWEFVIELRNANRLPEKDAGRFIDILLKHTAKRYPEYACHTVIRIIQTIKNDAGREKLYKSAIGSFSRRPDLQGRLLIALGEDHSEQEKKKSSLKVYEQAALRCVNYTEIVLDASARAEKLLMDAKRRDRTIKMYRKLFNRVKKPKKTLFRRDTAHYQLGKRLVQLLADAGKDKEASRVRSKMH